MANHPEQSSEPSKDERLQHNTGLDHSPQTTTTRQLIAYHPFSLHVLALLMPFSVFGTLARLGLVALASYDGQSIFPLAWVQAMGCGIMGLAVGLRDPITLFYPPLYTAISSGFCGSLTTFSGWELDVFLAWSNTSNWRRIWIYDVIDGLTQTLFTLAASLASFSLGYRIATTLAPRALVLPPPRPIVRWTVSCISVVLYILTIPIFVRLDRAWRPLATAALVFSYPGALTRYILSTYLNPLVPSLPIGTLVANELATALLAGFHVIQRASSLPNHLSCSILQGLMDGYCGCLSTVSTFIAEAKALKGRKSSIYVTLSFLLGQILILLILGPAWWTGRIHENNVCTFS